MCSRLTSLKSGGEGGVRNQQTTTEIGSFREGAAVNTLFTLEGRRPQRDNSFRGTEKKECYAD